MWKKGPLCALFDSWRKKPRTTTEKRPRPYDYKNYARHCYCKRSFSSSPSPFCCACSWWKECIERGRKRPRWRGRPLYRSIPHSHSSFLRILQWAPMTLRCFPFATHGSTTKGRRICFDGLFSLIQLLIKTALRCNLKDIHKSLLLITFLKNCDGIHFNCCIRIVNGWCKCREPSWSMGGGSSSS